MEQYKALRCEIDWFLGEDHLTLKIKYDLIPQHNAMLCKKMTYVFPPSKMCHWEEKGLPLITSN